MITFISGGARSGKSSFAEKYTLSLFEKKISSGQDVSLYYIATAIRSDKEMENRIEKHISSRSTLWKTFEAPFDLYPIVSNLSQGDVVLVDCLTVWLNNMLFEKEMKGLQLTEYFLRLLTLAGNKSIDFVMVSNDLNEGVPIANSIVRDYIYTLEELHKKIVHFADEVIQVSAGIPIYWKEA